LPDDLVEKMVDQLENGGYLKVLDENKLSIIPARPPEETTCADLLDYIHDSKKQRTRRVDLITVKNVISVLNLAEKDALDAIKDISIKQLASSEDLLLNRMPEST
jgi:hypothetical protein